MIVGSYILNARKNPLLKPPHLAMLINMIDSCLLLQQPGMFKDYDLAWWHANCQSIPTWGAKEERK
jgi:hypothetical protein